MHFPLIDPGKDMYHIFLSLIPIKTCSKPQEWKNWHFNFVTMKLLFYLIENGK